MYVLAIDTILVDSDEVDAKGNPKKRRYVRGDDVSNVRPDQLASMVRLHQAVEFEPPVVETIAPVVEPADWKQTPVASLDVSAHVQGVFAAAGLTTVADVLAYGAANGTLTKLSGLGAASEAAVQRAIEKVAKLNANSNV